MRTLHFDCFSGISGDMTLAALFDVGVPVEPVLAGIASLGLPIKIDVEKVNKGGFAATQIFVEFPQEDEHRHLADIEAILARGNLTPSQRDLALRIFRRLAVAEAAVHGIPVDEVHFHEVGALDSIADIAGAAIAIDLLGVDRFTSSSVAVGSGTVTCAHGVMPVPAPATAELLRGVPLRACPIKAELTTPTGAAILTTVVTEWVDAPALTIERIGHGAGRMEYCALPKVVGVLVGTLPSPVTRGVGRGVRAEPSATDCSALTPNPSPGVPGEGRLYDADTAWVLETNLDDIPGEIVGYAIERLFAAGALDVWTTPIQMKKHRPGVILSVLTADANLDVLEGIIFRETQTFGIRRHRAERHKLKREAITVETSWGPVRCKRGWTEGSEPIVTPEYDDCARIASTHGIALAEVYRVVVQTYKNG